MTLHDVLAQAAPTLENSWTVPAVAMTVIAAMFAAFGVMGKWLLSLASKMIDNQLGTQKETNVELNASTELRRLDMAQMAELQRAHESSVKRQERMTEAWEAAQKSCNTLQDEHRKHFDAELERLKDQGRDPLARKQ